MWARLRLATLMLSRADRQCSNLMGRDWHIFRLFLVVAAAGAGKRLEVAEDVVEIKVLGRVAYVLWCSMSALSWSSVSTSSPSAARALSHYTLHSCLGGPWCVVPQGNPAP